MTGTVSGNTGGTQGAGFLWNAKWDFTNADLSVSSTLLGTQSDQQCEHYWYCVDRSCSDKRWGLFCPLNSNIASGTLYTFSVTNLQFPYVNDLPGDMYSAISDNDGSYKAYQIDNGGSVLSPNLMSVTDFTENVIRNQHSQNNSFSFTTTNEIPANGYIQLVT